MRETRRFARRGRRRGWGKPRLRRETPLRKGLTTYISRLCRFSQPLQSAGCCRDVFLPLSAIPWGRGTRRFSRQSREKREAAAEAAASAALREAQCGARAAPRRFRRSTPNKGSLHLCGKRGVLRGAGGGGDGESRGKSLPNCPYSEKCWKNTKNI